MISRTLWQHCTLAGKQLLFIAYCSSPCPVWRRVHESWKFVVSENLQGNRHLPRYPSTGSVQDEKSLHLLAFISFKIINEIWSGQLLARLVNSLPKDNFLKKVPCQLCLNLWRKYTQLTKTQWHLSSYLKTSHWSRAVLRKSLLHGTHTFASHVIRSVGIASCFCSQKYISLFSPPSLQPRKQHSSYQFYWSADITQLMSQQWHHSV